MLDTLILTLTLLGLPGACTDGAPFNHGAIVKRGYYGQSGFYGIGLDTSGDGQVDVLALVSTMGDWPRVDGAEMPAPLFWMIDQDHDGMTDLVFVDRTGHWDCGEIVLYCDNHKANCPLGPIDWRVSWLYRDP